MLDTLQAGIRPVIPQAVGKTPVPLPLKELIERCWQYYESNRPPSMDYIDKVILQIRRELFSSAARAVWEQAGGNCDQVDPQMPAEVFFRYCSEWLSREHELCDGHGFVHLTALSSVCGYDTNV
ncbi:hypothetical protein Pelo_13351 [Pelomyxa schiedti]|nr:hypothetical protein Pelo_13351 [Pelomyxa schiedti]